MLLYIWSMGVENVITLLLASVMVKSVMAIRYTWLLLILNMYWSQSIGCVSFLNGDLFGDFHPSRSDRLDRALLPSSRFSKSSPRARSLEAARSGWALRARTHLTLSQVSERVLTIAMASATLIAHVPLPRKRIPVVELSAAIANQ